MTRRSGGKSGWSWRRCTGPILTGRTFRITAPAAGGSVSFIFIWISFYYIDYCLAQSVALMFWDAAQKDRKGAWDKYMKLILYSGTLTFNDLLKAVGFRLPMEGGGAKRPFARSAMSFLDGIDTSKF